MNKANRDTKLHEQGTGNRDSARLKRKASSVPPKETTLQPQGDDFPSPETLALIAANTVKLDGETKPRGVVEYAYNLLVEARKLIGERRASKESEERRAKEMDAIWRPRREKQFAEYWKQLQQIKEFPTTLKKFLTVIVRAGPAESEKRFRGYLQLRIAIELEDLRARGRKVEKSLDSCVEEKFSHYRDNGFANWTEWREVAHAYKSYWEHIKSRKARDSAKKRLNK